MGYDDTPLPVEENVADVVPDEEKLSGDMRELYDRLLPSNDSDTRRLRLAEKLEKMLYQEWPDSEFKAHIFGSSGNLLCTSESDGKHFWRLFHTGSTQTWHM